IAKAKYADDTAGTETKAGTEAKAGRRREVVWIDDALPPDTHAAGGGINLPWTFVAKSEHPPAAGEKSLKLKATGLQQAVFEGGARGVGAGEGDRLFASVFIDPKDPPKEIMIQWHTTGWNHRVYWGENRIDFGKDRSPERRPRGELPKAGEWVRLEIP